MSKRRIVLNAVFAAAFLGVGSAFAQIVVPGQTTIIQPQVDVTTQNAIRDRELFQLRQQLSREQDRNMLMQPVPRVDTPVVRPTCPPASQRLQRC